MTVEDLFGEPISVYTRQQAIEDGVLVDMSQGWYGELAREAGIRHPVAVTRAVFERYVALTDAAKWACNDERGRWWDVCWMFALAARAARRQPSNTLLFSLHCVVDANDKLRMLRGRTPGCYTIKSVIGPDDTGAPCITLMLPEED